MWPVIARASWSALRSRNAGQGVMIARAFTPCAASSAVTQPVASGCAAAEAGTAGSWTRRRHGLSCAINARDGEFLVEWVFSLYASPSTPITALGFVASTSVCSVRSTQSRQCRLLCANDSMTPTSLPVASANRNTVARSRSRLPPANPRPGDR